MRAVLIAVTLIAATTAARAHPGDVGIITTVDDDATAPWSVDVTPAQQQQARDAFAAANALLRDALFVPAAARYREAIAAWDHPAFHYDLALALLNLDDPIATADALERALGFGDAPLGAARFALARQYLRLIERQLGRVEVVVGAASAIATLTYDSVEVSAAAGTWSARVRAGEHTLAASARGYESLVHVHVVAPGATKRVELAFYQAPDCEPPHRNAWVPYSLIGLGLTTATAAILVADHRAPSLSLAGVAGLLIGTGATLIYRRPAPQRCAGGVGAQILVRP